MKQLKIEIQTRLDSHAKEGVKILKLIDAFKEGQSKIEKSTLYDKAWKWECGSSDIEASYPELRGAFWPTLPPPPISSNPAVAVILLVQDPVIDFLSFGDLDDDGNPINSEEAID